MYWISCLDRALAPQCKVIVMIALRMEVLSLVLSVFISEKNIRYYKACILIPLICAPYLTQEKNHNLKKTTFDNTYLVKTIL